MSITINNYANLAREYQKHYDLRSKNQAWQTYQEAKAELVTLIFENQKLNDAWIPLLKVDSGKLKFVRLQERTLVDPDDFRLMNLTAVTIRCEQDEVETPYPCGSSLMSIKTVPLDNPGYYSVIEKYDESEMCEVKLIGTGNTRMVVHTCDNVDEIESHAERTYDLYEAMRNDQVCQSYHAVKNAYKKACLAFAADKDLGIFVLGADNALDKAQKWCADIQENPIDLEDYLVAADAFETSAMEREGNSAYKDYQLYREEMKRHLSFAAERGVLVLPTDTDDLVKKIILKAKIPVEYRYGISVSTAIQEKIDVLLKLDDDYRKEAAAHTYAYHKSFFKKIVRELRKPYIMDGTGFAIKKEVKWRRLTKEKIC